MTGVWEGIAIGAGGGAGAGITILAVNCASSWVRECCDKQRVYKWLCKVIPDNNEKKFRSTRAIASHNNLTEDRVRYICSRHKIIYLSTGEAEDMWGIDAPADRN